MRIVVNRCFGGFSLSAEAQEALGIDTPYPSNEHFGIVSPKCNAYRADPRLVDIVVSMGSWASGSCAELEVVEIPDDADWYVQEYDGKERIAEGRTW